MQVVHGAAQSGGLDISEWLPLCSQTHTAAEGDALMEVGDSLPMSTDSLLQATVEGDASMGENVSPQKQ